MMPRYFYRLGFMQRRKPQWTYLFGGAKWFRLDEAHSFAALPQLPPRDTRRIPEEEPCGSVMPPDRCPIQSKHHSNTFPCMS